MVWITFILSSAVIVYAATQLAKYGDAIAIRTRLGGMFIGVLLMAGATSLPEVLTAISSLDQGVPNLAAGNLLGSNMFNMFVLAVLDLIYYQQRILRKAALKHALTGSLATFIIGLAVFFMLADIDLKVGWVGLDSIAILIFYIIAIYLIQANTYHSSHHVKEEEEIPKGLPELWVSLLGFALAAAALVVVAPLLVKSSVAIADITGLGTTFVGTTLVALVTSLPELVTTIAAARLGAMDMAIGNLFGSNLFNVFALGLTDLFFTQGRFLAVIDPAFLLVGLLGLLMTGMGLIGNLARLERRLGIVELDALALILTYVAGLLLLYSRGIGA